MLVGVLAGLFGIGGGAVIIPILYEIFRVLGVPEDVRMQLCVGTSLAIIVPTTLRSYFTHRSKNLGLDDVVRKWTLPAIAGVATGVAQHFSDESRIAWIVFDQQRADAGRWFVGIRCHG